MSNRTLSCVLFLLAATSVLSLSVGALHHKASGQNVQPQRIGLVYTAPHEIINQVVRGFRDELAEELPKGSYDIIERHASGDSTQYATTVDSVLAQRPAIIAPITTPISQIVLQDKPRDLPMVFIAVTDPVGARLVDSIALPGKSTGVSDLAPFEEILRFIKDVRPNIRRIGLPYSPEEEPAVFGRDQIVGLAPQFGITIDPRPITSNDELATLLRTLAQDNDALLVGSDNAMFEAAPLIVKTAMDANKPVFAGDSTSIKAGAVGGYTIDYYQVGREAARLVVRVLRGESPGTIPVLVMRKGILAINRDSASRLHINFSPDVLSQARIIYPQ